jgi:hypothetical protein
LTANTVAGTFTVTAQIGGQSCTFTLTNQAGPAAAISVTGGNAQDTIVGTAFATLLQATVTDAHGNPVAGAPVLFAAPTTGPSGSFTALPMVVTDGQGIATAPGLVANHARGTFMVSATAAGVSTPAAFLLTNTAVPVAVKIVSGNKQHAAVNTPFAVPLTIKVSDAYGQPIPGIAVEFVVVSNGVAGAVFSGSTAVQTNAAGVATAPGLTANSTAGSFTIEAWVAGVATPVRFKLTNLVSTAVKHNVSTLSQRSAGHMVHAETTNRPSHQRTAGEWWLLW